MERCRARGARDADFRFFYQCLVSATQRHGCHVHAYVFMTNHVHLLMTPETRVAQGKAGRALHGQHEGERGERPHAGDLQKRAGCAP